MESTSINENSILERVIKNASRFLRTGAAGNLDPFSKLVLEAIASEIYLLSDNALNIEVRLLEKLASILVPTAKTTALPAHAVLSAQPVEPEYVVEEITPVHYEDFLINKEFDIKHITFFPAVPVCLKKGIIRTIITNGKCFSPDRYGNKELIGNFLQTDLPGMVWIGLDMDPHVRSLEGLSFYWDFSGLNNQNEYIRLFEFASWSINGERLQTRIGFGQNPTKQHTFFDLLSGNDMSKVINREVYNHYGPQFVTIADDRHFTPTRCPDELADIIAAQNTSLMEKLNLPLLWIGIHFPPVFSGSVLEQCIIHINSFPIIQKNLRQQETKLDELKNIIPLTVSKNEHFLSVQSVCDSSGRSYYEKFEKNGYGKVQGSYSVRHGGCERFDSRAAKDYLHRLDYLLTEELAIFASGSKENVSDLIREMQVLLKRMKNLSEGLQNNGDVPHYLLLDTPFSQESMSVSYWTTNGKIGNYLSPGLPLLPSDESGIDFGTAYLAKAPSGGREPLNVQEKVICLKNALTTRGRIFTREDIASFCMAEYPGIITSVRVKQGIMQGRIARRSLIRTIDVYLSFSEDTEEKINKDRLILILGRKLKECSPETFNYRILLQ